jgi:hypothetical protein
MGELTSWGNASPSASVAGNRPQAGGRLLGPPARGDELQGERAVVRSGAVGLRHRDDHRRGHGAQGVAAGAQDRRAHVLLRPRGGQRSAERLEALEPAARRTLRTQQVLALGVGRLARGHVLREADHAQRRAGGVVERAPGGGDPPQVAVGRHGAVLGDVVSPRRDRLGDRRADPLAVLGVDRGEQVCVRERRVRGAAEVPLAARRRGERLSAQVE